MNLEINDLLSETADILRTQDALTDVLKVRKRSVFENIARDTIVSRLEHRLINSYIGELGSNPKNSFIVTLLAKINVLNDMDNFGFAINVRYASDNKLENRIIFDDGSPFYENEYDEMVDDIDRIVSREISPEQFIEKYAPILEEIVESKIIK